MYSEINHRIGLKSTVCISEINHGIGLKLVLRADHLHRLIKFYTAFLPLLVLSITIANDDRM